MLYLHHSHIISFYSNASSHQSIGCNFEEARRRCEDKFSKVLMSKNPVVFILHGHGTQGVLKQKIRDWLKRDKQWVKRARPADPSDGGDAFTMVELKSIQY